MNENNHYKLGLFVILGIILLFSLFFLVGMKQLFESKIYFSTTFDESVQGLDIGSPVKFRGVPIGRVTRVTIGQKNQLIRVDMEIVMSAFHSDNGQRSEGLTPDYFKNEVQKGLRCQLDGMGITGLKYIELDYHDSPSKVVWEEFPGVNWIPSQRSLMSDIRNDLPGVIAEVRKVANNFNTEIMNHISTTSKDFQLTLKEFRNILEIQSKDLDKFLTNISETSCSFKNTSDQIQQSLQKIQNENLAYKLDQIIQNCNSLITESQKQLKSLDLSVISQDIKNLLTLIRQEIIKMNIEDRSNKLAQSLEEIKNITLSVTQLKEEINFTLQDLSMPINTLNHLGKLLFNDPSIILFGKQEQDKNVDQIVAPK